MQRIIQITLAGHLISIEEDGFQLLQDYMNSLNRHFSGEDGREEIIHDIESRIAELFQIRLQSGAHAIDKSDALKVMETLGPPSALNEGKDASGNPGYYFPQTMQPETGGSRSRRLYRDPHDKVIGGVCSGIANYFDIDPVIMRLIFAVLFLTAGVGLVAYILAWIIIPVAKTPEDLRDMSGGHGIDFETIKKNVAEEMETLKKKGEEMSRELKDFFKNKK